MRIFSCLSGAAMGAGLMYFLDPDRGRRRRALLRDQIISCNRQWGDFFRTAGRDLRNRIEGVSAEIASLFTSDHASDDVIAARVRAKIGRYVAHPRAVEVEVHNGRVILSGPVLANEVEGLVRAALAVRGVTGVDNQLDVHREAGNISSLQGGQMPPGEPLEIMQENWSPAFRLLAGIAGGALLAYGFTRRAPAACAMGSLGLAIMSTAGMGQEQGRQGRPGPMGTRRQPAQATDAGSRRRSMPVASANGLTE